MPSLTPGSRNLITDVPGLTVGNAEDAAARSGVTVLLCPDGGAIAAVDTRGGAPGTRETDALAPSTLVDRAHAIVLSGGSAFGLDAAGGVQSFLAMRGQGFAVRGHIVPIVPAAILFDLANGGDKGWGATPPYRALGTAAAEQAGADFALGNAGAGLGAQCAGAKGGLGSASAQDPDTGYTVGALVAVNAHGSPLTPGAKALWAAPFELAGEFGAVSGTPGTTDGAMITKADLTPGGNTTIGIVATDAPLTVAEAQRIAIMAHDGYARALHPVHTPFDGDVIFALATGDGTGAGPAVVSRLGSIGADCMTRAIGRAILAANPDLLRG